MLFFELQPESTTSAIAATNKNSTPYKYEIPQIEFRTGKKLEYKVKVRTLWSRVSWTQESKSVSEDSRFKTLRKLASGKPEFEERFVSYRLSLKCL